MKSKRLNKLFQGLANAFKPVNEIEVVEHEELKPSIISELPATGNPMLTSIRNAVYNYGWTVTKFVESSNFIQVRIRTKKGEVHKLALYYNKKSTKKNWNLTVVMPIADGASSVEKNVGRERLIHILKAFK